MDFTSGIGVTNTGHAHPRVVEAIQNQAAKLIHGQANIVYHEPMIRLSEELSHIVPPELDTFFFSNSGAEAVEAAVKLARAATGKQNIIVFQGSFHGRTHATMAMTTSKTIYRAGYQPLVSGIFVSPFPYAYAYGWDEETTVEGLGMEYIALPIDGRDAINFDNAKKLDEILSQYEKPVLVHCGSSNRVGALFALRENMNGASDKDSLAFGKSAGMPSLESTVKTRLEED